METFLTSGEILSGQMDIVVCNSGRGDPSGDIHLGVTGLYVVFKYMRLDGITWARNEWGGS